MRALMAIIALFLLTFPALSHSSSEYQVAVITAVKPREATGENASDPARYDVSVKVGNTIYVVLYTQPLNELPAKYAVGRELLVLVGRHTITYNDMLGRSLEVPIESQRPATDPKHAK